jgi:hypothetical protein
MVSRLDLVLEDSTSVGIWLLKDPAKVEDAAPTAERESGEK